MKKELKKIYVGKSKIHNKGIFAGSNIKKGEIVFIIKGKLVKFFVHNKKDALYGPNWVGISKNIWIDPNKPSKYLNHSCNPSCGIKGKVNVVALKDLKKGDEILIDYSIIEEEKLWYMNCNCGNKNCRGKVKSIIHLPIKTYKKYLPYVPNYFKKVYDEYHGLKQENG